MPDYKVAERIALLSVPERNAFRRILRETGSIQQLRLYDILIRQLESGQPADKKKAFARVFEQAWTRDKDYLIRNLFRLLHTEIENFLLEQQQDEFLYIRKKTSLLRRMMKAGQHAAFRAAFDELLGRIQDAGDVEAEAELLHVYSEYNLIRYAGKPGKLADTSEAMFTELELIRTQARRRSEALYARHALVAWHTRKKGIAVPHLHNAGSEHGSDEVVNYFRLFVQTLQAEPALQPQLAIKTLLQLEQVNSPLINRSTDVPDLYFVMASATQATGNFDEARLLFDRLLKLPEFTDYYAQQNVIDEYGQCLFLLEEYKEAAHILGKLNDNFLPCIYALLLCNESDQAQKRIKNASGQTPETALAQLCINLVQQGALNISGELKKLKQNPAVKKTAEPETKLLLTLIEKLATDDNVNTRLEITDELSQALSQPHFYNRFPLFWLRKHLSQKAPATLRRLY
ncbi:MAG: hypothetical protein IM638_16355 [Bacteroidetes bacterium]|nr:hypothetical protein [Bacteroidota bacterium]